MNSKKFYIGVHSTNNINDGYLGSGVIIKKSIKKHGKNAHVREILAIFSTREKALRYEKFLVNEELLSNPNCMNLVIGGLASNGACNEERRLAISIGKLSSQYRHSENTKDKLRKLKIGTRHTPQTVEKITNALSSNSVKWKIGSGSRGKPGHNRKPVIINGKCYESIGKAEQVLGFSYRKIKALSKVQQSK